MVSASVGIPATRFLSASPDGMNATGESDLVNYVETLQGLHKDIFVPRLKPVDRLLAAHFGLPEEEFEYTWGCIFPESAAQKEDRMLVKAQSVAGLCDSGVLSLESGLEELKNYGAVSKDATVGENPNQPKIGAKDGKS
jgi:hypothetical protein